MTNENVYKLAKVGVACAETEFLRRVMPCIERYAEKVGAEFGVDAGNLAGEANLYALELIRGGTAHNVITFVTSTRWKIERLAVDMFKEQYLDVVDHNLALDARSNEGFEQVETQSMRESVRNVVDEVIEMRYGFRNDPMTQQEIGEFFDLTKARIGQIEKKSKQTLIAQHYDGLKDLHAEI